MPSKLISADSLIRAIDRASIVAAGRDDSQHAAARGHNLRSALRRARVKHVDVRNRLGILEAVNHLACFVRVRIAPRREDHADSRLRLERHARRLQLAGSGAHQQGRQVVADHRQNHLRFRVAESDIELDDFRSVSREHQPDEKEAAELAALAAHALEHRQHDLAHHTRLRGRIEQRAWRIGAHAAGVRACIAVERALVIFGGSQRERARAIAQNEERRFAPDEQFLDDEARAGLAEPLVDHHRLHLRLCVGKIRGNDDALARGEAIGFQHDRKSELAAPQHGDAPEPPCRTICNAPSARYSAA